MTSLYSMISWYTYIYIRKYTFYQPTSTPNCYWTAGSECHCPHKFDQGQSGSQSVWCVHGMTRTETANTTEHGHPWRLTIELAGESCSENDEMCSTSNTYFMYICKMMTIWVINFPLIYLPGRMFGIFLLLWTSSRYASISTSTQQPSLRHGIGTPGLCPMTETRPGWLGSRMGWSLTLSKWIPFLKLT